jgi:hypothetical protein
MGNFKIIRRNEHEWREWGFRRAPWAGCTIYMIDFGTRAISWILDEPRPLLSITFRFEWEWSTERISDREVIWRRGPVAVHYRRLRVSSIKPEGTVEG